jgi:hypothetical protein
VPARISANKSAERKRLATTLGVSELEFSCSGCRRLAADRSSSYCYFLGYETVRQFHSVVVGGTFEEGAKFARARRVAQLAQGFGFDLADAFAGDGE